MNKLREELKKNVFISWDMTKKSMELEKEKKGVLLEQITDDFSIKFYDWANVNAYKFPTKTTTTELLTYFKENVYNK